MGWSARKQQGVQEQNARDGSALLKCSDGTLGSGGSTSEDPVAEEGVSLPFAETTDREGDAAAGGKGLAAAVGDTAESSIVIFEGVVATPVLLRRCGGLVVGVATLLITRRRVRGRKR
jgi:hypothetical protein